MGAITAVTAPAAATAPAAGTPAMATMAAVTAVRAKTPSGVTRSASEGRHQNHAVHGSPSTTPAGIIGDDRKRVKSL